MNRLLRSLQELERRQGLDECPTCKDVMYAGAPGLFVLLFIGGRHGTPEEFAEFFHGCPECGEDVKTAPIVMAGMVAPGVRGKREVPDPWPIHEWPRIEQGKPQDAEYNAQINELWDE